MYEIICQYSHYRLGLNFYTWQHLLIKKEHKKTVTLLSIFFFVWSIAIISLSAWLIRNESNQIHNLSKYQARAFFQDVVSTRSWNAEHGGVYVPVTKATLPNKYLNDPDRDIISNKGVELTKINPAYMTRQIAEIVKERNPVWYHITSLKPLRPENLPDAWEKSALSSFEEGIKEAFQLDELKNGTNVFRFMAPLITEKTCLKCHLEQGYELNDIRGGISVNIDASEILSEKQKQIFTTIILNMFIWLIGSLALLFFGKVIIQDISNLKKAKTVEEAKQKIQALQLKLIEYATSHSSIEVLKKFLDEVEILTHSTIGFYHFYDDNKQMLSLQTWSTNTIQNMCTTEGANNHYSIEKAGVWADCARDRKPVIHNDYASLPNKKGLPEGHAPIIRELVVPVFRNNDIVAVLGVGNKEGDYNEYDVNIVQSLADLAWETVSRKLTEESLFENEEKYRRLSENSPAVVYQLKMDLDGTFSFTYINESVNSIMGVSAEDIKHDFTKFLAMVQPEDQEIFLVGVMKSAKSLDLYHAIIRYHKDGNERWFETRSTPEVMEDGSILWDGFLIDITEKKKTEAETKILETQLQQAQKMESIGRLAGGVAHDYNNALTAIMGFTELAMMNADPAGPLHDDLNQVLKAGRRAKEITRQLLAFARKQTISPKVLNLNMNIESMYKMLQHLIGEDIDFIWLPGKNLWPVKMDPSQIDQILANLCVNARDSIAGVGKITIETDIAVLDEAYCADHAGFVPGEFVLLAVSDNGCGMDKKTQDNIFEPFFTTKAIDKGTGLGLATVYGIVKQNNAFINVYSEKGKGTTIKIYLPRNDSNAVEIQEESTEQISQGLGETILLVEDDISILKLAQKILKSLGYKVLTADTPKGALSLAKEHSGKIHLLVTDVIMPEMNGREMSEQLQFIFPDFKCIFMSGYTANAIAHHGVLDEGVNFIQKPFSKNDLATIVRKVLDGE